MMHRKIKSVSRKFKENMIETIFLQHTRLKSFECFTILRSHLNVTNKQQKNPIKYSDCSLVRNKSNYVYFFLISRNACFKTADFKTLLKNSLEF